MISWMLFKRGLEAAEVYQYALGMSFLRARVSRVCYRLVLLVRLLCLCCVFQAWRRLNKKIKVEEVARRR